MNAETRQAHEDGAYGVDVSKGNEGGAKKAGFQIVLKEGYSATAPDLSALVTKLKRARPDVIFHTGYNPDILAWACLVSAFMIADCESEIEMVDRAIVLNPNSFNGWHCRGWVYRNAGRPEEAIRSFERAIRMNPVDPRLQFTFAGMAMAFIELGRFDEAIVAGKKAQRHNPCFSSTYRCLASAFAHLGRDAEAREAVARLVELDPGVTISAWIARGGQSNATLMIEGLRRAGLPE